MVESKEMSLLPLKSRHSQWCLSWDLEQVSSSTHTLSELFLRLIVWWIWGLWAPLVCKTRWGLVFSGAHLKIWGTWWVWALITSGGRQGGWGSGFGVASPPDCGSLCLGGEGLTSLCPNLYYLHWCGFLLFSLLGRYLSARLRLFWRHCSICSCSHRMSVGRGEFKIVLHHLLE